MLKSQKLITTINHQALQGLFEESSPSPGHHRHQAEQTGRGWRVLQASIAASAANFVHEVILV